MIHPTFLALRLLSALVILLSGCSTLPLIEPTADLAPPTAGFVLTPEAPQVGQEIEFTAAPQSDDRIVADSYQWDFGDGAIEFELKPTITHVYAEPGVHRVTLTIMAENGLSARATRAVRVSEEPTGAPAFPYTFGAGTYRVGVEIAPGTYRTRGEHSANSAGEGCLWQRLSGLDGTSDQVVAFGSSDGPAVVKIRASDRAFSSKNCARWSQDLSAISDDPEAPFGPGTHVVGVDVAPGVWEADGEGPCFWTRLGGFSGEPEDAIELGEGTAVLIHEGDAGFHSETRCGTWHRFLDLTTQ